MALLHSAQDVHSAVRTVRNTMVWPPSLEDLQGTFEEFVPTLLYNFLALTLVGEDKCSIDVHNMHTEKATVEDTIHRRILSIGQDIVYAAHSGRDATPKHILLSSAVHHLTRSAQIVTMLNHFGHGVSLSYVQEMNTALAEVQLNLSRAGDVPLTCSAPRQ